MDEVWMTDTGLTNICGCADIRLGIRSDSRYFPIQYTDVFICDDDDDGWQTCRQTCKMAQRYSQ